MHHDIEVAIAVIVVVGVAAQWLASALRVPSVLVLLPAGVLVGPVTGLVEPEELFGDALFPVVAVAVGLVLFEGGTSLRLAGSGGLRRSVMGLVTIGALITLVAGALAAAALLDLPIGVGAVLGAILVVSGPTVVLPLLEAVRLREPVGSILRWEAIVVDPIGAVIAVGVFEAVREDRSAIESAQVIAASAAVGLGIGVLAAAGLAVLLGRQLVPDRLHSPITLAAVVGSFVLANELSPEAGLFAVTVMGVVLANQRLAPVAHIASFGEDLGVLLLGGLFVVLGATIDLEASREVLLPALGLLVVLLVVRWAAVWAATVGAGLSVRERAYLALIAPRGIVAASIAALFGAQLQAEGVEGGAEIAPAAFVVVIGVNAFVSVIARPAARWLRVAEQEPRGILLAGDAPWVVDAAGVLADLEVPVLVVHLHDDGDRAAARGVLAYQGRLDDDDLVEAIERLGIAKAVVATGTQGADSFLVDRLSDILGRREVFLLDRSKRPTRTRRARAWGRRAFPDLARHVGDGASDARGEDPAAPDAQPDGAWHVCAVAPDAVPDGSAPLFWVADGQEIEIVQHHPFEPTGPGVVVVAVPEERRQAAGSTPQPV